MPHRQLETKRVEGGDYEYQKVFGEDTFAAAGVIRIPAGSKKPGKTSRDNAFVSYSRFACMVMREADEQFFFVHKGGLNVNIHLTSFNMGPGAMFYVPRGKLYYS
jgi:centromere protein C